MNISAELLDELVAHALADPGNEVCGVVAVQDAGTDAEQPASGEGEGEGHARAVRVLRATNIHHSPLKFEIDPKELLGLYLGIEAEGQALGAIYHSHVRSRPYPSQTDINFAANWPGLEWVIIGLADEQPQVRSYLIDGAEVKEVALEAR
jgi:proteasome lid subunit RPN8/RPN11